MDGDRLIVKMSSLLSGSPERSASTVYQKCIRNYQAEVSTLKKRVSDLQDKLKDSESPDRRLRKTCESLQHDKERLSDAVATLQKRNLELSAQISQDESQLIAEKNDQLSKALDDANDREQKLIAKYKRAASKFRDLKANFEQIGDKYRRLIAEKQEGDKQRLELMNRQLTENEAKERLNRENADLRVELGKLQKENENLQLQVKKHTESIAKVMKHYQSAKASRVKADERLNELQKLYDANFSQLKDCAEVIKRKTSEIEKLRKEKEDLERQKHLWSHEHAFGAEDVDDQVVALQEENTELHQEIEVLKQKVTTQKLTEHTLKARVTELESLTSKGGSPSKTNSHQQEMKAQLEESNNQIRSLTEANDRLQSDNDKLLEEIESLKSVNLNLQQRLHTALNEFAAAVEKESEREGKKTATIQSMASEINTLKKRNEELITMLENTQAHLESVKEDNQMLIKGEHPRILVAQLQEQVERLAQSNSELTQENEELRQEFEARDQDGSSDTEQDNTVGQLIDELNSSREENMELRKSVKSLKQENRKLKNSLGNGQLSEISQSIEHAQSSLDELRDAVAEYSTIQNSKLLEERAQLEDENQELKMRVEELEEEKQTLKTEILEQKEKAADMINDNEFAAMVDQLEGLRSRNAELESLVEKYRQGVGESGLNAVLDELEDVRSTAEALQKENEALKSERAIDDLFSRRESRKGSPQERRVFISSDDEVINALPSKKDQRRQQEIERLKSENKQLRRQLEHMDSSSEEELTTILSKLSQTKEIELISQIDRLKEEINQLKENGNAEQYQKLLERYMKVANENESLKSTCEQLRAQILAVRKQGQAKEYQELEEKNRELAEENAAHVSRIEALEMQLAGGEREPLLGSEKACVDRVDGEPFQFDFSQVQAEFEEEDMEGPDLSLTSEEDELERNL